MTSVEATERFLARYTEHADVVLRWGLGLVILLAGAHKLVDPAAWSAYAGPVLLSLWPVSMDLTMVANGVVEVGFGAAIVADVYTTIAAAVVAVSLAGVALYLVVVAVTTGEFLDVAIRDVGLTMFAIGVTLRSAAA